MSDIQWYIQVEEGKKAGPLPFDRLQRLAAKGKIGPETNVRTTETGAVWTPARTVSGLFSETETTEKSSGDRPLPSIFSDSFTGPVEVDTPSAEPAEVPSEPEDSPEVPVEEKPKEKSAAVKVRINPLGGVKKPKSGIVVGTKDKGKSSVANISIDSVAQPAAKKTTEKSGTVNISVTPKAKPKDASSSKVVVNPFAKKTEPVEEPSVAAEPVVEKPREIVAPSPKKTKRDAGSSIVRVTVTPKPKIETGDASNVVAVVPTADKSGVVPAAAKSEKPIAPPSRFGLVKIGVLAATVLFLALFGWRFAVEMKVDVTTAAVSLTLGILATLTAAVTAWVFAVKSEESH